MCHHTPFVCPPPPPPLAVKRRVWGHIYWQIHCLVPPFHLPSGSVPHCISNQICHWEPPHRSAGGGAGAGWLGPPIYPVDGGEAAAFLMFRFPLLLLSKPSNSRDGSKNICIMWHNWPSYQWLEFNLSSDAMTGCHIIEQFIVAFLFFLLWESSVAAIFYIVSEQTTLDVLCCVKLEDRQNPPIRTVF